MNTDEIQEQVGRMQVHLRDVVEVEFAEAKLTISDGLISVALMGNGLQVPGKYGYIFSHGDTPEEAIDGAWAKIMAIKTPEQRRIDSILQKLREAQEEAQAGDGIGSHALNGLWSEIAANIAATAERISKNAIEHHPAAREVQG